MLALGDWQFHRAESGNALSWAYTFEWPIFAVFVVVFWAKTIKDEFRAARRQGRPRRAARGAGPRARPATCPAPPAGRPRRRRRGSGRRRT